MADKIAQYLISLGGDDSDLKSLFAGVKSRLRSDVDELRKITDKLQLFGDLENTLPQVQRSLDSAKQKVKDFTAEIDRIKGSGKEAPKALIDGLAAAEKAANSATKELARQQGQLTTLGFQLNKAGVDTGKLAAEQTRLAIASKAAADAAGVLAAKQTLGLTTLKDITPEITKQKAAFDLLQKSGVLSASETAAAQKLLNANIKELTGSVSQSGTSFKQLSIDTKRSFTDMLLPITAGIAAITAIGTAFNSVTDAAKNYNNLIAQVGTVTNLSKAQLDDLGSKARALSQELGIGVTDALKGLYELVRSGVSPDNSIEVLRVSALAAKAAFTDTATGAKAASVLIDAFGIDVRDLGAAFDIVLKSAQTGGPTLAEFAANAGLLGNAARATGADFKEVTALLNIMTDASNDAAGSSALLTKVLINLDKPETRAGLHNLGIDGLSLVETFRALDARGLKINDFLDLGIAGGKAAAQLAALTENSKKLPEALNNAATAAGTLAAANARIYDTPEERKKRFDAALEETKIKLGESVGASSGFASALAVVMNAINTADDALQKYNAHISEKNKNLLDAVLNLFGYKTGIEAATVAQTAFNQASIPLGDSLERIDAKIKKATETLPAYSKALADNTAALQKLITEQVAALIERANQEVALLDKSTKAQVASAAKNVEILTKLNADILALLQKHEVAVQVIVLAREDALKKSGKKQVEIEQEIAKLRVDALAPVLDAYQKHYAALITQAAGYKTTLNKIENESVAFNEGLANRQRTLLEGGMTDLQKYASRVAEVDRLIAKGRETASTQGFEAAKKYFDQADKLSETVKGEVISDGLIVITQFQAEQKALDLSKRAAQAYNDALGDAKGKAEEGAEATEKAMADTSAVIKDIQGQLDTAKETLSKAITIKISKEIDGIDDVRAQIDDLVRTRTQHIKVVFDTERAPDFVGPPQPLSKGGPVWKQYAQQLASGGPVFRRPSWSKVPGVGNTDSVPAMLPAGSFVVRKAASQLYGDGLMSKLARGYAAGGTAEIIKGNQIIADYFAKLKPDTLSTPDISPTPSATDAIGYASFIASYLRFGGVLGALKDEIGERINAIQRPGGNTESAIQALIRAARLAASNNKLENFWLHSGHSGVGFKDLPDWYDVAASRASSAKGFGPFGGFDFKNTMFAAGGPVGEVPAWLTPGEWVFPPKVVNMLGGGFLRALNASQFAPPRMPSFQTGGPVGNVPERGSLSSSMGDTFNFTINAAGGNLEDPSVQRRLLSGMREILRRSGKDF